MNSPVNPIPENITLLMKLNSISSYAELARMAEVKQPTVHRIVSGESLSPRIGNLEKIAEVLGVKYWMLSEEKLPQIVISDNGKGVRDLQEIELFLLSGKRGVAEQGTYGIGSKEDFTQHAKHLIREERGEFSGHTPDPKLIYLSILKAHVAMERRKQIFNENYSFKSIAKSATVNYMDALTSEENIEEQIEELEGQINPNFANDSLTG